MRSRKFLLFALVLGSLWFSESFTTITIRAQEREPRPASGALLPAPINPTFDAPVQDFLFDLRDSKGDPTGEPPGWDVRRGLIIKDRSLAAGDSSEDFARLQGEDAELVSSPFTIDRDARALKFSYRLFNSEPDAEPEEPPPEVTPNEGAVPTLEPEISPTGVVEATPEAEETATDSRTVGVEDDGVIDTTAEPRIEEGETPEVTPSLVVEPETPTPVPATEEPAHDEEAEDLVVTPLEEIGLQVYVLSGDGFARETLVFEDICTCERDWRDSWIDIEDYAGQNVQLKFVRVGKGLHAVAIDNVATNLAESKLGRHRSAAFAGDPVDTTTGNFTETYVDIPPIPGKSVPLGFARTYNSDTTFSGALGPKWTHTYSMNVTAESDGSRTVRYADGRTSNYSPPVLWVGITYMGAGDEVAALRSDGAVFHHQDLNQTTENWEQKEPLPAGIGWVAITYMGAGDEVAALRSDGVVFHHQDLNQTTENWEQKESLSGTGWVGITYMGQGNEVAALRSDGSVYYHDDLNQTTANWEQKESLPAGTGWVGITYMSAGDEVAALRSDGTVYYHDDLNQTTANWEQKESLPGSGWASIACVCAGDEVAALRSDGSVYYHDDLNQTTANWEQKESLSGGSAFPQQFGSPSGAYDILVKNSDSTYQLTTRDQIRYIFDSTGKLTSIKDRNDHTTTLTYSGNNLTSVKDHANRTLTFTYSGSRIASVTDPLNRTVTYNTSGNLTSVSHVLGGSTSYTYSSTGNRLLTETNPNGSLVFENTYSTAGRVYKQKRIHNGSPVYTCFKYGVGVTNDSDCPAISPGPSSGQTIVVDPLGNKTKYSYDSSFRTTQIVDAIAGVSSFAYDSNGNLKCVTDQLNRKTAFSYDASGNLTEVIDPLNTTTNCTLKSSGQKTTTAYNSKNDPTLITDKLGRKVQYSYDTAGNLTQVDHKDASSSVRLRTCFTVDAAGLVTAETQSTTLTNCTGNTTEYEYDSYGNLVAITDPRFSNQSTPPQTTMTYDLGGRMLTVTNELGQTTTYTYNALGQVLTVTDNLDNSTTYTYDDVGNRLTVTDPLDNTTTFDYDNLNRLTSVVDALDGTTSYTYDANDNRLSITNARGRTTEYTYDDLNRLETSTDPLDRTASLEYDAASRIIERTDARDLLTKYFYDDADRLTSVEYWDGSLINEVEYEYDAIGNRTEMDDSTGITAYVYDALNRVTSVTFPGSNTVSYTYDNAGNRSRITYPDSKFVDYDFDESNRLVSVTDWLSNETTYAYNDAGQLTTTTLPTTNTVTSTRAYDGAGRLDTLVNAQGSTVYSSFDYTLDARGFRTGVETLDESHSFTYDDLGRLTQASFTPEGQSAEVHTYTYDAVGNRTSWNSTTYTYDDADQLTSDGSISFGYDANGNQVSRGSDSFEWDHDNRLTAATIASTVWTHEYNGDGVRMSRGDGTTTVDYVWDVAGGLPMLLQDGTHTYVYGLGLIAIYDGSEMTYRLVDGLGSTVNLCDQNGDLIGEYAYDAYGNVRSQDGAETEFSFAGEQSDPNGLDFLRARYYDPELGRFLGRDPAAQGNNYYAYALNNPLSFADPSGAVAACTDWRNGECYGTTEIADEFAGFYFLALDVDVGEGDSAVLTRIVYSGASGEVADLLQYSVNPGWHSVLEPSTSPPAPTSESTPVCDVVHEAIHAGMSPPGFIRQHSRIEGCNISAVLTIVSIMWKNLVLPADIDATTVNGTFARTTVETPCTGSTQLISVTSIYLALFPNGSAATAQLKTALVKFTC